MLDQTFCETLEYKISEELENIGVPHFAGADPGKTKTNAHITFFD